MSVTENVLDFKDFEAAVYREVCRQGIEVIRKALEDLDAHLAKTRDTSMYRHKGLRKTTVKTVMGEVELRRAIYETSDGGAKRYVYLLDRELGLDGAAGLMSPMLSELIAEAVCEGTYRSAARSVSEATGQTISHTAAWMVAQAVGERLDAKELQAAEEAARGCGKGGLEAPVLFEEMDGIWLDLQGESRKLHGGSHEMKLAIAYDGAEEVAAKRYRLANKVACAGFFPAAEFMRRKEGAVAGTYSADEIQARLLNGDGAAWIRQGITDETVHFQLDAYHVNKAIRTYAKDQDMRKMITVLLYEKKIDEMLESIAIMADSVADESERENLSALHTYFTNNKDGLIPIHRRGLDLPAPPEGKTYRRLGAMESNVFTLIGNRMKGRRRCWSIDGANNLARLLCLKHTGRLTETLENLTPVSLPERYAEETAASLSAAAIGQSAGKGYDGYHQSPAPPTSDFKWLRGIGAAKLAD